MEYVHEEPKQYELPEVLPQLPQFTLEGQFPQVVVTVLLEQVIIGYGEAVNVVDPLKHTLVLQLSPA